MHSGEHIIKEEVILILDNECQISKMVHLKINLYYVRLYGKNRQNWEEGKIIILPMFYIKRTLILMIRLFILLIYVDIWKSKLITRSKTKKVNLIDNHSFRSLKI